MGLIEEAVQFNRFFEAQNANVGAAYSFAYTVICFVIVALFMWILLSPLLTPGIVLGLSTLVFWGRLGVNGGLFTVINAVGTIIILLTTALATLHTILQRAEQTDRRQ